MADDLYYVGVQPTVLEFDGSQVVIGPSTVVHRDSPLRAEFPSLFTPLTVHWPAPEVPLGVAKAEPKSEPKSEPKTRQVTR